MKEKIALITAIFLALINLAHSQECGSAFTDPGGQFGNYPNSIDYIVTISPANPGEFVTVNFNSFNIEAEHDALYVFNGNSIAAPQIASSNPVANVPGGVAGGYWGGNPPGPFTSTSPDGCLTFRFRSDSAINKSGWSAQVNCPLTASCLTPTNPTVNSVTTSTAVLGWTENGSATSWEIFTVVCGLPVPTPSAIGQIATTNPFTVTGLNPANCYDFYIRAICPSNKSSLCRFSPAIITPLPLVCGGQFLDNGSTSNYLNNSNSTTTICPENPGEIVTVSFHSFKTEATWDGLYVFDGASITDPQIMSSNLAGNGAADTPGAFWGTTIPGPFTASGPTGCLTFNFKSDGSVVFPGWVANVTCTPNPTDKIILIAYIDENNNGIKDVGEAAFTKGSFVYELNNDGTNIMGYGPTGQYTIYDSNPANSYDFSYQMQPEFVPYYNPGTTTYNNVNIVNGAGMQILYFPITVIQAYNDVSISITTYGRPRPGYFSGNRISYSNHGLLPVNGTITYTKPAQITTLSVPNPAVIDSNGFTYNFTNLLPNETRSFGVFRDVPLVPVVNIGDLLTESATISITATDMDLANNSVTNTQEIVNSYDPNDKMESRGKTIPIDQFNNHDYFFYTIRFQNEGNTDAFNIRIEDFLDAKIDESSVLMITASHNYTMKRIGNQLVWDFNNIFLIPRQIDEELSKGYIQFKVRLKPGYAVGDIVPNYASIYFDSNPAILTETFTSEFTSPLSVVDFGTADFILYPNPANSLLYINAKNDSSLIQEITIYDILGKKVYLNSHVSSNQSTIDVSQLSKGIYLVEITTENHLKQIKKLIIQ